MVQIQSEAGQRLHAELVKRFGPIEDGHGRKVYGHKRTAAAWRAGVLADLRGEAVLTPPVAEERIAPKPSVSAERTPPVANFVTAPPSAARASRMARAACLAVLAFGALAAIGVGGNLFGLIASLPVPKLMAAALGRIS